VEGMIRILENREYYTEHERELNKEEKQKYEEEKLKEQQEQGKVDSN